MNFADYRRSRNAVVERRKTQLRRPVLDTQEQRLLYSVRMKTLENRTLMTTLKSILPPSQFEEIIVEYALRLRKARSNFDKNNFKDEWYVTEEE